MELASTSLSIPGEWEFELEISGWPLPLDKGAGQGGHLDNSLFSISPGWAPAMQSFVIELSKSSSPIFEVFTLKLFWTDAPQDDWEAKSFERAHGIRLPAFLERARSYAQRDLQRLVSSAQRILLGEAAAIAGQFFTQVLKDADFDLHLNPHPISTLDFDLTPSTQSMFNQASESTWQVFLRPKEPFHEWALQGANFAMPENFRSSDYANATKSLRPEDLTYLLSFQSSSSSISITSTVSLSADFVGVANVVTNWDKYLAFHSVCNELAKVVGSHIISKISRNTRHD